MRQNLLILFALVIGLIGCTPSADPVPFRPNEKELLGIWALKNSPRLLGTSSVPNPGESLFTLNPTGSVMLSNMMVEDRFFALQGPPSGYKVVLKTEHAQWAVEDRGGRWCVEIITTNKQAIELPIYNHRNDLELWYRPDPDGEPFVYFRVHEKPQK